MDQCSVVEASLRARNLVCSGMANHVIWADQFLVQYAEQRELCIARVPCFGRVGGRRDTLHRLSARVPKPGLNLLRPPTRTAGQHFRSFFPHAVFTVVKEIDIRFRICNNLDLIEHSAFVTIPALVLTCVYVLTL